MCRVSWVIHHSLCGFSLLSIDSPFSCFSLHQAFLHVFIPMCCYLRWREIFIYLVTSESYFLGYVSFSSPCLMKQKIKALDLDLDLSASIPTLHEAILILVPKFMTSCVHFPAHCALHKLCFWLLLPMLHSLCPTYLWVRFLLLEYLFESASSFIYF